VDGVIEPVAGKQAFKDGRNLYRMTRSRAGSKSGSLPTAGVSPAPSVNASAKLDRPRETWLAGRFCSDIVVDSVYSSALRGSGAAPAGATTMLSRSSSVSSSGGISVSSALTGSGNSSSTSGGSASTEWIQLLGDAVYNPYEWFHLEVRALAATSAALEQFVASLELRARSAQLPLVQAALTQRESAFVPRFQLDVPPSAGQDGPSVFSFLCEVLERRGFIPEKIIGPGCFLHKSGMVWAHIVGNALRFRLNVHEKSYSLTKVKELLDEVGQDLHRPLDQLDQDAEAAGQPAAADESTVHTRGNRLFYYLYLKGLPQATLRSVLTASWE
jgi:hypothetical protein